MKITYAMRTNQGDRPYSEDSVRAVRHEDEWLFVLADGLGGMGHGETASSTAAQSAIDRFGWDPDRDRILENCIETAQEAVRFRQKENLELNRMATTFVALRIFDHYAEWVHVGDSRLYYFHQGRFTSRTLDHSVPQMLVNVGSITPDAIRHHPDRSRLIKIIGNEWEGDDDYSVAHPVLIREGDSFLLCSDGLWEWVEDNEMEELLLQSRNPLQWLSSLEKAAAGRGEGKDMDNYSTVCVFVR